MDRGAKSNRQPQVRRKSRAQATSSTTGARQAEDELAARSAAEEAVRARRFCSVKDCSFAVALAVAVCLAYQPAWQGGLLWDDVAHITRPELRTWHGLYRIWFEMGATLQYYPLLHSLFWLE